MVVVNGLGDFIFIKNLIILLRDLAALLGLRDHWLGERRHRLLMLISIHRIGNALVYLKARV